MTGPASAFTEQLGLITASGKQPSAVGPARALLQAQHERLAPVADGLAGQVRTTTGSDYVVTLWRHESVCATLRFLDALLATVPAQPASLPG